MDVNESLACGKEWSSQDQGLLLIFFHVKHYEIYKKDKLFHLDEYILN